ncbi:MAG: hypothetical protein ACKO1O_15055 [Erythrobacter sp.]
MGDRSGRAARAIRLAARAALWFNALVWTLFAGGMIFAAVTSLEARADAVFVQVLAASTAGAVGSIAAAFLRPWGAALALIGGCGVLAAWIVGDSGRGLRLPIAILLGLFALAVAAERRARFSLPAR